MRDYAEYFIARKTPSKRGVSAHRDIDWWMAYFTSHLAKLLFVVLLGMLAIVLKSFWQVAKSDVFFPVGVIEVVGDIALTQAQDIDRVLADAKTQSFFTVEIDEVSEALTALPWVASANVTRRWPDILKVAITERQPAYRWGDDALLDQLGNRFPNTNPMRFAHLPKLQGVDGREQAVIEAYKQLTQQAGMSLPQMEVDAFALNQYLSWELHLRSGVVIKFGRDNYLQRLKRFVAAFQATKLPDLQQLDVLDFRYNRGFAARWKPEFMQEDTEGKLTKVASANTREI